MKQIKSNDAMKETLATSSFRKQMSQSMTELRSIMASGASPTFNGRLTARTIKAQEVTEDAGFRTALYFFDADLDAALARNASRPEAARVPEVGVRGTFAKLEKPGLAEPFDEIFRVRAAASGEWIIERIGDEI